VCRLVPEGTPIASGLPGYAWEGGLAVVVVWWAGTYLLTVPSAPRYPIPNRLGV